MTNIGKENKMGKLQTFLASAIIGLSPAGGGNLNAQTTEPQWPKTEKQKKPMFSPGFAWQKSTRCHCLFFRRLFAQSL